MKLNEDLFDTIAETGDFKDFEQYADLDTAQSSIPAVETEVISDTEIKPEGPEQGLATGIANLIHDLIIDVNEAIQNYNNAAANMEQYPELQAIMQKLAGEEFAHIGELEKALEVVSPNATNIEEGEVESESNLDPGTPIDESLNEDTIIEATYVSSKEASLSPEQLNHIKSVTKNWVKLDKAEFEDNDLDEPLTQEEINKLNNFKLREFGFTW